MGEIPGRTKEKILQLLGDLDESRLLDVLLDSFAAKKLRIIELNAENLGLQEKLHKERELLRAENRRILENPLSGAEGQRYYFTVGGKLFWIEVRDNRIRMFQRGGGLDIAAQQIERQQFWDWRES